MLFRTPFCWKPLLSWQEGSPIFRPLPVRERILAGPLGRAQLFKMVGKKTEHKTQGNYPATERILEVVETGLAQGTSSGYDAEARAFGELAMTPQSQALRSIFCQYGSEERSRQ